MRRITFVVRRFKECPEIFSINHDKLENVPHFDGNHQMIESHGLKAKSEPTTEKKKLSLL